MSRRALGSHNYLTLQEAARELCMSDRDLRTMAYERGMVVHIGGRPRVPASRLYLAEDEEWAKKSTSQQPPPASLPALEDITR